MLSPSRGLAYSYAPSAAEAWPRHNFGLLSIVQCRCDPPSRMPNLRVPRRQWFAGSASPTPGWLGVVLVTECIERHLPSCCLDHFRHPVAGRKLVEFHILNWKALETSDSSPEYLAVARANHSSLLINTGEERESDWRNPRRFIPFIPTFQS